jgi:lactate 2-monooxygenase
MSPTAWAYVSGGAGEGRTMQHNREAFERWRIVPRMLHGVTQRDLGTSVLGTQLTSPVLLAPIGAASIVATNSDVTVARGAAAAGTPYVISSQGSDPMEDTAAGMGSTPFWYQLYWVNRRGTGRLDDQAGRNMWCTGARRDPRHYVARMATA